MLSSIHYGTFANYSPRGQSELSEKSRQSCSRIKAGKFHPERLAPHLNSSIGRVLQPFLDSSVTFVPVPKSHPLREGALWPSLVIAEGLRGLGYGENVSCLVKRTSIIKKSATAGWGNRPSVKDHYETLEVERNIFQPLKITLIDDVLTKGTTVFACARLLHEHFPKAEIRAFALFRTQGFKPDIETFIDPSVGTISYNDATDSGSRNP